MLTEPEAKLSLDIRAIEHKAVRLGIERSPTSATQLNRELFSESGRPSGEQALLGPPEWQRTELRDHWSLSIAVRQPQPDSQVVGGELGRSGSLV